MLKNRHCVEHDEVTDANGFDSPGHRDSDGARHVSFELAGFRAGEPAWDVAEDDLGAGLLDGGGDS